MNSGEYTQLIKAVHSSLRQVEHLDDEFIATLSDLKKEYASYQSQLNDYMAYPNFFVQDPLSQDKLKLSQNEIFSLCRPSPISCEIYEVSKNWLEFKDRFSQSEKFVRFYITLDNNSQVDITDCICFNKKSVKKSKTFVKPQTHRDHEDRGLHFDENKLTDFED